MRPVLLSALLFCLVLFSSGHVRSDSGSQAASRQILVCYFHRTVRCPTCQRIGELVERSVSTRLAREVAAGQVKVVMVDFQAPANAQHAAAYKVTGPTLIVMQVQDGKVVQANPAPRIWALFRDDAKFADYVETQIRDLLDKK